MKRTLCCVLLSVLILALFSLCAHADTVITTRDQLIAHLTAKSVNQPVEIPFEYASSLSGNISDSGWMSEVLYDAGIFSASWSYGGGKCTFKKIQYMPEHRFCQTENDVLAAFRSAVSGSVNIRLTKDLYSKLKANDFAGLYQIEGAAGFSKRKMTYYDSCRLFIYSEIIFAENFSSANSINDFKQLMRSAQSAGHSSFTIHCSKDTFQQLTKNDFALLYQIEGEAGFKSRSMSYNTSKHLIIYSNVVFAQNFTSAGSLDELRSLMYAAQAKGLTQYTIHCSEMLFNIISVNDFHVLHGIEGEAGFRSRNMTYNSSKYQVTYSDIDYAPNFVSVQTFEEFKQWMQTRCLAIESEFSFHCSVELYNLLCSNDFDLLHALEKNCGIYVRNMRYFDSKQQIIYSNIEYYPGYYVARSVNLGRMSSLSSKNIALYNEARSILQQVLKSQPYDKLQLQFALQEAIMTRIEYLKGEEGANGDFDTAIGALLNGRCECDGYADAFYLLADMAGLNVRFQYGSSIESGELHQWNIIEHGGKWYFTDLTWCDVSGGTISHHLYSNIGLDIARHCYDWNTKGSLVPLSNTTSSQYYYCLREGNYFENMKEAYSYVNSKLRGGNKVEIMLKRTGNESVEKFVDKFSNYISVRCSYNHTYTDSYVSFAFYPRK